MDGQPNLLRWLVTQRHWKQTTFRAQYEQAARRLADEVGEPHLASLTIGSRQADRWLYGEVKALPHPDACRVLEHLFGHRVEELFSLHGGPTSQHEARDAWPAPEAVEGIRQHVTDALDSSSVTEASLDDWEQTVRRHGQAYRHAAPSRLLADLVADFGDLQRLFARWQPSRANRRICRITAGLAGLVSMTLTQLDQRAAARRWSRTARLAAEETGDPAVQSWVSAQETFTAFYSGQLLGAIDLAQQGQVLAGLTACPGGALAAALEARAHATLGHRRQSHEALGRAGAVLDHLDGEDLGVSAFGYREAQLRFHEGYVLTQLRDTAPAWSAQRQALALYADTEHLDRTLVHLDRADCSAQGGRFDEAFAYAGEVLLGLEAEHRSGLVLLRARGLLNGLPPAARNVPVVREFRDLLALPGGV